ncbi:hypothetical protein [Streptomyces albogriseolus]
MTNFPALFASSAAPSPPSSDCDWISTTPPTTRPATTTTEAATVRIRLRRSRACSARRISSMRAVRAALLFLAEPMEVSFGSEEVGPEW